jgi:hypothetical protein
VFLGFIRLEAHFAALEDEAAVEVGGLLVAQGEGGDGGGAEVDGAVALGQVE